MEDFIEQTVSEYQKLKKEELFRKLSKEEKNDEFIAIESLTFFQSVKRDFKKNKRAVVGLIILIIVVVMAILGPVFCPYAYDEQNMALRNANPSAAHWFGTDKMGRDIFVRILYGARISLGVGISAPKASWETLCEAARELIQVYPMQTVYPLVAICLTIISLNFVGEGLERALDPKRKR